MTDGGPAFPRPSSIGGIEQSGMSRRAWLAGMALQGMLASDSDVVKVRHQEIAEEYGITTPALRARYAYEYADAMIAHEAEDD